MDVGVSNQNSHC